MNPVLGVLQLVLRYMSKLLPENIRPFVGWVADLLGTLNLPPSDPRVNQVAELVAQLIKDIEALDAIQDVAAREKARLILENRFGRAWIALSMSGGV